MPTKQVARQMAVLPQLPEAPDGLVVRELVAFGRFPYQGFLGVATEEDDERIDSALEITGLHHLADRLLGELSGGQRQLAWIAMARLAQDTQLLLLDEPTTFLDMAHQLDVLDVLDVLAPLHREERRTIVMVLHDINQAARYAQHMVSCWWPAALLPVVRRAKSSRLASWPKCSTSKPKSAPRAPPNHPTAFP